VNIAKVALLALVAQAVPPASLALAAPAPTPLLGVAWYPEQWPEASWEKDLSLMEAAGIRMVRIGEFAWSSLEPAEGRFEFAWLDRAIVKAAAHRISTVLGTPTDAPPAWLTAKYPDTLRVDSTGRHAEHGNRRQFSYTSPRYRELCRRIAEKMAERYGSNPNVIGWQIGNEYTEDSYDDHSRSRWRQWLQAKYKTLDSLNEHWTTAYWSQTYSNWDQIPMEAPRGNPGLLLDYRRFVTDMWREFQRNQLDAIRAHTKAQFVTTNLGGLGWADRFNRAEISADLDFISWDDYAGMGHLDPVRNGAANDLVRGWKRQNFWVMEAQPGFVDWAQVSNALDKGETRAMAWQAIGHGADAFAFWQWRSALNGQEQYHGTLVGPDGDPVPFYEEARQLGRDFAATAAALEGTQPVSEAAILHDYDSRWAIDFHPQTQRYDQIKVLLDYYEALRRCTQSVDIVPASVPLADYRLVLAPSLNVIGEALARHLVEYVRQGGHLVLGPRSGMKDGYNSLWPNRQPGPLATLLGGRVEQYYALLDDVSLQGAWGSGKATIWAEALSASGAEVLMRYGPENGWLDGQPAVLTRAAGKGRITYLGALLDGTLMRSAMESMSKSAGLRPAFGPLPEDVEVCRRAGASGEVFVLINHGNQTHTIGLPRPMRDLLSAGQVRSSVTLPRQVVAVLQPADRPE
jgi:beta-galactosidase